jgi:hypothetical protein
MLKPLEEKGYCIKVINYTSLTKAYADDLAFTAKTPKELQLSCDKVDEFLVWSKTMKAKPKKCVAVGFRQFDKRSDSGKYDKYHNTKYSAFNPNVSISGAFMRFVFDETKEEGDLLRDHFKFLGRWISIDLTEFQVRQMVRTIFDEEIKLIGKTKLTGFMKLWLYQHYLLSHLAWPFLIHDFPLSFAKELESSIAMVLKRWAGLYRGADNGALFRSKSNFGLGLTSVSHFFKKMQIIKCSLLDDSRDPAVAKVYQLKAQKTSVWKIKWAPHKILKSLSAEAMLNLSFPAQKGKLGLGHGLFVGSPSPADVRRMVTQTADKIDQDNLFAHSVQLERQGEWSKWCDHLPFDMSWQNLIYGPGQRVISFVLNGIINTVQTPVLLKLWGYRQDASCMLCRKANCTLHHILSNCKVALNQARYTWRHDSVLLHLKSQLTDFLEFHNNRETIKRRIVTKFVKKGHGHSGKSSVVRISSILDDGQDWKLLVDFTREKIVFPPEVIATSERPDIILISKLSHQIILVELTCPAEEGIESASLRKKARYGQLLSDINDDKDNPWKASLFTIEAGARGLVAHSMLSFLRKTGFTPSRSRTICKQISTICARCSYAIYLARSSSNWDSNRALIELPD